LALVLIKLLSEVGVNDCVVLIHLERSGWPLSVKLLNTPYRHQTRNAATELLAYLPTFSKNQITKKEHCSFCKTLMFHLCWKILSNDEVFNLKGISLICCIGLIIFIRNLAANLQGY
jgi:hypothetical protein